MLDYILRYRKAVFLFLITTTIVSVIGITRLRFDFFRALPLPDSDPAVQANLALSDHFGGMEMVTFVVESKNILDPASLDVVKALTDDVKQMSGVASPQAVASIANVLELDTDQNGFSARPFLANTNDLASRVDAHPYISGLLVNKAHTAALVIANLGERAYPDASVGNEEFLKTHYQETEALLKKHNSNEVKVSATGTQLVLNYTQSRVKFELGALTLVAMLFLIIVFFGSFKSWARTGLACCVMAISLCWTLGTMGWIGIPLSQTAIYITIVVLAVGSSYSIHVISSIDEKARYVKSYRMTVKIAVLEISLPLLTVSLAAALSGISLLTFDLPDIRELGVFQSLGITFNYLLAFFLLPVALLALGPKREVQAALKDSSAFSMRLAGLLDRGIKRMLSFLIWLPIQKTFLSILILVGIIGVFGYGTSKIIANFEIEEGVPNQSMPRQGFDRFVQAFGKFRMATIVVKRIDNNPILTPEGLEVLSRLEKELGESSNVRVLPTLPFVMNQIQNALHGENGLPKTQEQIDQALLLVGKKKLGRLVDREGKRALFSVAIYNNDPRRQAEMIQNLRIRLDSLPPGYVAHLGGAPIVVDSINHYMIRNKVESIVACLIIVLFLCILVNSSVRLGLISVLPAAISALVTFGMMGFFNINLDMSTATITTIAIGVGVDFAVHFLLRLRATLAEVVGRTMTENTSLEYYRKALRLTTHRYGKTIVFDSLSNILGFSPLMLSSFPILKISGLLLMSNQVIVILSTFFVTPLLILVFKPDLPRSDQKGQDHELADQLV